MCSGTSTSPTAEMVKYNGELSDWQWPWIVTRASQKILALTDTTDKQRCQCEKRFALFPPFLPPLLIHILHSVFFPLSYSKPFILLSGAISFCVSFSWSQRPPTHFSVCCKYRGLNGMVLYLAGRCAIMEDHLDHNRTLGLRFEACHVLSLPFFISVFFCVCPLSHFLLNSRRLDSNFHNHLEVALVVWEYLTPTCPGFSDITCCTCKTMWMDNYSPQFEKHTVWVFIMHIFKACKVCVWERGVLMPLGCPVWSETFLQGHSWNICSPF